MVIQIKITVISRNNLLKFLSILDDEINDLKSYRNNMLNKSDVEFSSISIANDKGELLQNQIIQLYEKRQSIERNIELLQPLSLCFKFPSL